MAANKIVEKSSSMLHFPSAEFQFLSSMYSCAPGMVSSHTDEQSNHGPGVYAVPVLPFMGTMPGFSAGNLISLTYKIPTRTNPAGAVNEETIQEAQQQNGQQRQQVVARRFQFAFQVDLILVLKLAAVVFLFNQEGSRQRFILLTLFASLIYLYQTGAFAPILRWLRRAGAPPQPQAAVRPENAPPVVQDQANDQPPEGIPAAENQPPIENGGPVENEHAAEVGRGNGIDWWGIVREIKLVVVGFVTSLFPGFHQHND